MNLLLFSENELSSAGELLLVGEKAAHLRSVLKVEPGAKLKVGAIDGAIGRAEVMSIDSEVVRLKVNELNQPSEQANLTLLLAMPRPQMLKRVLELAPQFGVSQIHLVAAKKVEKSYFSSPLLRPENYRQYLLKGMEQAMVTSMPQIHIWQSFFQFAKSEACSISDDAFGVIAEVGGPHSLNSFKDELVGEKKLAVAIGPEGGWTADEVAHFQSKGFALINLGKRVLRVDMAVCSMLAQIELLKTN